MKITVDEIYEKLNLLPPEEFQAKALSTNVEIRKKYADVFDRQTGRTTYTLAKIISRGLTKPGSDLICFVPYHSVGHHISRKFCKMLVDLDLVFSRPSSTRIRFENNSEISFMMLNDAKFVLSNVSATDVFFEPSINDVY